MAIGHDPTSLKLAVVNEELNPSQGRVCNYTTACTYSMYSCRYLRFINNETIIQVLYILCVQYERNLSHSCSICLHVVCYAIVQTNEKYQVPFTNHSLAIEAAQRGDVWGVIHFTHNFTDEYISRENLGNGADLQTVIGSQIGVSLDWSSE